MVVWRAPIDIMTLERTLTNIAVLLALSTGSMIVAAPASAAAWAELGDAQLRSDVALLANAGMLANLKEQAQVVVDFNAETGTTVRLAAGAINDMRRDSRERRRDGGRLQVLGDGSYVAQKLGGAIVYAGLVDHW